MVFEVPYLFVKLADESELPEELEEYEFFDEVLPELLLPESPVWTFVVTAACPDDFELLIFEECAALFISGGAPTTKTKNAKRAKKVSAIFFFSMITTFLSLCISALADAYYIIARIRAIVNLRAIKYPRGEGGVRDDRLRSALANDERARDLTVQAAERIFQQLDRCETGIYRSQLKHPGRNSGIQSPWLCPQRPYYR